MDTAGRKAVLAYLMSARGIDEMSDEEGLAWIARSVDAAGDDDSVDGLRRALALAEELGKRELASAHRAELHYFIANAWACIRGLSRKGTPGEWEWEQEELEQEIFNLRTALVLARGTLLAGSAWRSSTPTSLTYSTMWVGRSRASPVGTKHSALFLVSRWPLETVALDWCITRGRCTMMDTKWSC